MSLKILFASDSYKGSLTSERIAELLEEVTKSVFPDAITDGMLVADGGEGTMEAVVKELNGEYRSVEVENPLGERIEASYGIVHDGNQAIIEMATASGLPLLKEQERNPLKTSSYGTGTLIKDVIDQGIRNVVIGIGGSATNDGGMGAMSALGVRFYDKEGNLLKGSGEELESVSEIDLSHLDPAVKDTKFTIMCDVTNPLLGEDGATFVYGRQKGADDEMLKTLEKGMENYARVVEDKLSISTANAPGAGAAGGLGFALLSFLNAELRPGIETVLDLIHFDKRLEDANLVITGEGRMDRQSSFGKVVSGVGNHCKNKGVPAVAIVGGLLDGYQEIYENGICSIATSINGIMDLENAIEEGEALYKDAAFRLLKGIKCGMEIQEKL